MITYKNITDNPNLVALSSMGPFAVFEHQKDLSNTPESAPLSWFAQEMNVRQRQLLCRIQRPGSVRVQAGSMQWVAGAVESETGLGEGTDAVKSFLKGAIKGAVTGEAAVKPVYSGDGILMLEPTYKHILLEDVSSWGPEGIVLDDGLFLAAEGSLAEHVVMRKNLSSIFGGHGLFSLCFKGSGVLALESFTPREELFEFELENDVLKIDGNLAIAWSGSLQFTVERSSKTLLGSVVNKEGLVNVYRGTGRILMAPTIPGTTMQGGSAEEAATGAEKKPDGATSRILSAFKL
ncbi:MAG: AIM24 family protein [Kiritimatiellae bacterium]|nr:AIM24 family protein [Kiritimatiellia bacterium]